MVHIFHAHNKEAYCWAEKGAKGGRKEWEEGTEVIQSDVTGVCGFWDGRYRITGCGAVHNTCGPVYG